MIGTNCTEGNSHLDRLIWKTLGYEHHRENFREVLSKNITPFGLRIKEALDIVLVNENFHIKRQKILKSAENELIESLLLESETIIAKTGMVYIERNLLLDLLFQKSLRYEHHHKNFRESLSNKVSPYGLPIKKAPAIFVVNKDFHIKWHMILKSA